MEISMNHPELLRHIPTGEVYVFQPELAKRKDMEPVVPDAPVQLSFDFDTLMSEPEAAPTDAEQAEAEPSTAGDVERTLQMISDIPTELPAEPVAAEVAPAEEQPRPAARKRARNAS